MRYTVLVDNLCTVQGLYSEWGYSGCLETPDAMLLLDTGGLLHVLEHNMRFLGFNPRNVTDVVLSHGHFDHTAGLFDVFSLAPQARLWAGDGCTREKRGDADQKRLGGGGAVYGNLRFNSINPAKEIVPGVTAFCVPQNERDEAFITHKNMWQVEDDGSIVPDRFEDDISLLVKGDAGYSVLLGCAHTGLPNILRYIKKAFGISSFNTVLGGTHLCSMAPENYPMWMDALKEFKVTHWRPCHCTGFKAASVLAKTFDDVDWAGAGTHHNL